MMGDELKNDNEFDAGNQALVWKHQNRQLRLSNGSAALMLMTADFDDPDDLIDLNDHIDNDDNAGNQALGWKRQNRQLRHSNGSAAL